MTSVSAKPTVFECRRISNGQPKLVPMAYVYSDNGQTLPELAIMSDYKPTLGLFRDFASFTVEEIPCGLEGRGFVLHRSETAVQDDIANGIDPVDDHYCVLVSANGQDDRCDCRGAVAHSYCKHISVLRRLVESGVIDDPNCDPRPEPAPDLDAMAELSNMAGLVGYRPEAPF